MMVVPHLPLLKVLQCMRAIQLSSFQGTQLCSWRALHVELSLRAQQRGRDLPHVSCFVPGTVRKLF